MGRLPVQVRDLNQLSEMCHDGKKIPVDGRRPPFAADEGGRAAILCRRTRRQRVQVANPACRHGDADLKAGRQSFAADEGGKRPGNPCRIVSIGTLRYE